MILLRVCMFFSVSVTPYMGKHRRGCKPLTSPEEQRHSDAYAGHDPIPRPLARDLLDFNRHVRIRLRWYALAYIAGIVIAWRLAVAALRRPSLGRASSRQ